MITWQLTKVMTFYIMVKGGFLSTCFKNVKMLVPKQKVVTVLLTARTLVAG